MNAEKNLLINVNYLENNLGNVDIF